MLHTDQPEIKELLLKGQFGLEKENLRVDENGYMVHTAHPFPGDKHILRDFCENQVEVNTPVFDSAKEAVDCLAEYDKTIQMKLRGLPEREYLWPFFNPPYIKNEEDIPVALFLGDEAEKTVYREYLSDRYGRYKMTFCGIHFNYSFDEELLKKDFVFSGETDYKKYKNQFYIELAEKASAYGWLLVAVTAASPLLDGSFVEKKKYDQDTFNGMATVRCSELGYWNYFSPVFDYSNIENYADSIQAYVDEGLLQAPSELYYPIRLKPSGKNTLQNLKENGVNHIELRMFDLNPLVPGGVEIKDVLFAQLLLVWLASISRKPLGRKEQVQAVQNFKHAARYDLKTVKIVMPDGEAETVTETALKILSEMQDFYRDFPEEVQEVLAVEKEKFIDAEKRYAWIIRKQYGNGYVKKGIELAKERQEGINIGKK